MTLLAQGSLILAPIYISSSLAKGQSLRLGKLLTVLRWCRYQKDKVLNRPQELFLCTASHYLHFDLSYSTVIALYDF